MRWNYDRPKEITFGLSRFKYADDDDNDINDGKNGDGNDGDGNDGDGDDDLDPNAQMRWNHRLEQITFGLRRFKFAQFAFLSHSKVIII